MEKTVTDHDAIRANMQALKRLKKRGDDLLEYWGRLITTLSPSTEDYHQWAGNPDYLYDRYRQIQLEAMTPEVFDRLPPETQRPELDDPRPQYNPSQVTLQSETRGTVRSGPPRSKFVPGRYVQVARMAGKAGSRFDEHKIIVDHTWLQLKKGELVIPKDAEKKLTASFTHKFSDQQIEVAQEVEGFLGAFQKVFQMTDGKPPITVKSGKPTLDMQALKKV